MDKMFQVYVSKYGWTFQDHVFIDARMNRSGVLRTVQGFLSEGEREKLRACVDGSKDYSLGWEGRGGYCQIDVRHART